MCNPLLFPGRTGSKNREKARSWSTQTTFTACTSIFRDRSGKAISELKNYSLSRERMSSIYTFKFMKKLNAKSARYLSKRWILRYDNIDYMYVYVYIHIVCMYIETGKSALHTVLHAMSVCSARHAPCMENTIVGGLPLFRFPVSLIRSQADRRSSIKSSYESVRTAAYGSRDTARPTSHLARLTRMIYV